MPRSRWWTRSEDQATVLYAEFVAGGLLMYTTLEAERHLLLKEPMT